MSTEIKPEPIQGKPSHVLQMIGILVVAAGVVMFGIVCLWWGGLWGIGAGFLWSICAMGFGHQAGVGRGYRLAKPTKISMNEESWE